MAVKWTDNQQDAINARRGTVLVAAAAGSGKTAVLVQRAIERLTDKENPTPADRMLIVTFTRAAAAEMRARLERRLYEMLREDPQNDHLRRQTILLSQAHIGTVDSFCAEMVREFFHLLEVSPEFKILSDKQKEELTTAALGEALEAAYQSGEARLLADAFAGERDDRRLTETVLHLYEFTQSHPFPARWLEEKTAMYEAPGPAAETPWGRVLLEYAVETAEHCARVLSSAMHQAETCGDRKLMDSYYAPLQSDRDQCLLVKELAQKKEWDGLANLLSALVFQRRGALRGYDGNQDKDRLELLRAGCKDAMQSLAPLFTPDSEGCEEELRCTAPLARGLMHLTLEFARRYEEKKQERGFLDYSDLEHLSIRLFLREDGSVTPTAREVSTRFDEIMIDEYQDVNETQDSLFRAISGNQENLFMVGDVKQSIYGFRRAMPEIFLRAKRSYGRYKREQDNYPAYLVLDRNFRSRQEVTDSVNFVFSRLMSREAGDIDYRGDEMLVCGADYGEKPGCETELCLLERGDNTHAEEAEPAYLAEKIKSMMEGGFTVTEKGEERPARWGDFCILLRSVNKYAHSYAKELTARGVPARAAITGGFFAAPEVAGVLSFLRVVDNPNQDIPLLAVLMSPVYGFTPDDMAAMRLADRKISLYLSLINAAGKEPRAARVIEDLEEYRALAATMPSDAFLGLLYSRTGYPDLVLASPDGETRLANLRLLQRYARDYEGSGYHGVSGFVRFLDRLRENNSDLEAAELPTQGENAVQIMSIHKSKGLEFPVCIVAGCGRKFVAERSDVLLHPELGLGVKLRDPLLPARYSTMAREAIALETARGEGAEELRVLYVAMTRAKEKLILLGSGQNLIKSLQRLGAQITEAGISPYAVRNVKSSLEWLMLCALCHPDGGELRRLSDTEDTPVFREDYTPWHVTLDTWQKKEQEEEEGEAEIPALPDEALLARLKKRVSFSYPYEAEQNIPAKVSASKLTAEQSEEGLGTLSRPAWLNQRGLTPAQRGIALHDFMAFCDFRAAAKSPTEELARLQALNALTPEQAGAVELPRVEKFFRSSLGKRVLQSGRVEKERRFTAAIPAALASPQWGRESDEAVILQGAVDCIFFEGETLHIIDFKTDRVENVEELWRRYETQLRLYAYAMEQTTGKEVGELFLYSTWLGEGSGKKYERNG